MRILVTAGPTRQYIDSVRFITNASSGRMGCAVAAEAVRAGHEVTLLLGPVSAEPPAGCRLERFVSVADLKGALEASFHACDALVMAAAVGDFVPERPSDTKLARSAGPVTIRLLPTEDLLAGLRGRKRTGQVVVAFAVEEGPRERTEAKARAEMSAKGADFVVVNTPGAMGGDSSLACILASDGIALPWANRPKRELAETVISILGGGR